MKRLIPLLLLAASSSASAVELLTLVDSNGVVVGPISDIDDSGDELHVAFRVGKRTVLVQFLPSRVDDLGTVYYITSDCSGAPFMKMPESSAPEFTEQYSIEAQTLYVRDYSKAVQHRTALSFGVPGTCGTTNTSGKFALAQPVFDFSVYTPPFRVRASAAAPLYPPQ